MLDFLAATARQHPLMLLLDDLHWADPASLELLRAVARSLETLPILLVAAYRSDELNRDRPLHTLLPVLVREAHAARCDPRPLTEGDVGCLIAMRYPLAQEDAARLVPYLHRRAEGNPFFLGELARTLEEESVLHPTGDGWSLGDLTTIGVPPLLRQVIDGRLARLGEEVSRLLTVAAVIGQEVPLALLATVTGADEEGLSAAIEEAAIAHLMDERPDGTHARFVHALIREALYEGILPSRRRRLHRQVGEALAENPHADPDAVAYHLRQAGDGRAVEWLVRAGERAERSYAWVSAADRYAAAAAAMGRTGADAARRGWLLLRLSWLRRWADPQEGIDCLAEALRMAEIADDRALGSSLVHSRGALRCHRGDLARGIADIRRGINALEALPEAEREGLRAIDPLATGHSLDALWGTLGMWLGFAGFYDEAFTISERILGHVPPVAANGTPNVSHSNAQYGLVHAHAGRGHPDRAHEAFTRTSALFRATGNLAAAAQVAMNALESVLLPYYADRPVERQHLVAQVEESWNQTSGAFQTDESPRFARLLPMVVAGEWDEARRLALLVRSAPFPTRRRALATRVLAALARNRGEVGLAWALIREMMPGGSGTAPGSIDFLPALILQRVAVALALDAKDLSVAREWLEAHDRWLEWNNAVLGRAEGGILWAAYHRAAGDAGRAGKDAQQALADATEPRQPLALLAAHRLLGELDTDAGQYDDARAHLDAALALADACAAPYERALTLLAMAEASVAGGDGTRARALLDEVRAICVPLDAKPAFVRADALAARLASMSLPAPVYPDDLSAREVDVLRLIAGGSTNREIAATLFLSVRTVERHITGLYRKIDGRGRADATTYALRHALVPDRPPVPLSPAPQ